MNHSLLALRGKGCALFFVATFSLSAALAQEKPAADANPLPIGILNIQKISQAYKPFAEQIATLQGEAEEMQKSASLKQSELDGVRGDLQKAEPGSPQFQRLQSQFVRLQRDLQTFVQEGQQKIRDKELKLILTLHREIAEVLKTYCKAKGIRLVVRIENSSFDENQPASRFCRPSTGAYSTKRGWTSPTTC